MKKRFLIFSILILSFTISCDESLLDLKNPNELSSETFFENDVQANAAITAVYVTLQARGLWQREHYFIHDLLSDENLGMGSLEAQRGQVLDHTFDSGNSLLWEFWQAAYRGINRAHFVIDNIGDAEGVSESLRARGEAEARFLRALFYFELVSLFGDVPHVTEQATTIILGIPRESAETIYQETIFPDLEYASANLPESYGSSDLGRATKGAAHALKARIHLWRGEYNAAGQELEEVLDLADAGVYSLVDDFFANFTEEDENNAESIFEVQFTMAAGGANRWSGNETGVQEVTFRGQEYGFQAWRNVVPSQKLLDAFEMDDPRKSFTVYTDGDTYGPEDEFTYTYNSTVPDELDSWKKYQNYYKLENEVNQQSGINFRVIRLADVYLMMAEVIAEGYTPSGAGRSSDPLDYMNMVRTRPSVDMPPYPTVDYPADSYEEIMRAIGHERQVEFAAEQIRNRDIRRWRRTGKLQYMDDPDPIPQYKDFHDLLPIPQPEIDSNEGISNDDQNDGY